jgi:hypothetical protein
MAYPAPRGPVNGPCEFGTRYKKGQGVERGTRWSQPRHRLPKNYQRRRLTAPHPSREKTSQLRRRQTIFGGAARRRLW